MKVTPKMALEASIATGFGRVACGKILCADIEPSSSSKLQTTSHLDQSADLEIYTFCLGEWSNFQPSTTFLWLFRCRMCEIEVFNKKCDSAMFLNMVPIIFSAWQKMSSINNEVMFGPRRTWLDYPSSSWMFIQNVWISIKIRSGPAEVHFEPIPACGGSICVSDTVLGHCQGQRTAHDR